MERTTYKDGMDYIVVNYLIRLKEDELESLNIDVKYFKNCGRKNATYYVLNHYDGSYDIYEHFGDEPARNDNSHPLWEDLSLVEVPYYLLRILMEFDKETDEISFYTD